MHTHKRYLNDLAYSDHTDPFNRSALSMDQVTPDADLLQRISDWAKNKSASTSS